MKPQRHRFPHYHIICNRTLTDILPAAAVVRMRCVAEDGEVQVDTVHGQSIYADSVEVVDMDGRVRTTVFVKGRQLATETRAQST